MSTWLYKVKYAELVTFDDQGEPDSGDTVMLTVLADDAEAAISIVRKGVVGQERTVEGSEGEKYCGKVTDLQIDSAECISFVDLE
jgi:hypothetical protein